MRSIALIVAMARNRVIGRAGDLPWHLPEDLKRFKALTMGKPMIMGRKTWESIGRPLPGRDSIVVTRQDGYEAEGAHVVATLNAAYALADRLAAEKGAGEIMVIGGAEIYAAALPDATRVYLTLVERDYEGDTWFPELGAEWVETVRERGDAPSDEAIPHTFLSLEKIG